MNTKTMRLPPRRVLTPSGSTNKRKEREDPPPFDRPKPITTSTASKLLKPDRPSPRPSPEPITTTSTSTSTSSSGKGLELPTPPSNQLLAGYLAHEFLTKGTLLGQPWAQARPESPTVPDKKKEKPGEECAGEGGGTTATPCRKADEERERYVKVVGLLKGGGAHIPGVVNPAQLARFLHL